MISFTFAVTIVLFLLVSFSVDAYRKPMLGILNKVGFVIRSFRKPKNQLLKFIPTWKPSIIHPPIKSNITLPSYQLPNNGENEGLVEFHRIGRSIVRKAPDIVLVGITGLVATEMLQRVTYRYASVLPPSIQHALNISFSLIEEKMEDLARMQWQIQQFVEQEMSQMQHYQNLFVNKYLKTELLARIDSDIAPILYIFMHDKEKVERIIKILKDFVMVIALRSSNHSVPLSIIRAIQQMMEVGELLFKTTLSVTRELIATWDVIAFFIVESLLWFILAWKLSLNKSMHRQSRKLPLHLSTNNEASKKWCSNKLNY